MKAFSLIITSLVVFALLLASCSSNSSGGDNPAQGMRVATLSGTPQKGSLDLATPVINETQDLGPMVVMQDDFSDLNSGWETYSGKYGSTGYDQGGYVVEAIVEKEYNWGVAGVNFDNVRIDVDATALQIPGDLSDGFGVDCRIQSNGDGYGFRISSDGYAEIVLFIDGDPTQLYDWTKSDAINPAGETNHITAICEGDHLSMLVNDVFIAEVTDDTFSSGDLALSAISFSSDPVKVLFDDIIVLSIGDSYAYADRTEYPITLINDSGREVCWAMISTPDEDYWGDSWLTGAMTFGDGDTRTFDNNFDQVVDIRVLGCDYTRLFETYNLNLAMANTFTLQKPVVLARYDFSSYDGWSMGGIKNGMTTITQGDYYTITTQAGGALSSGVVDFPIADVTLRTDASLAKASANTNAIYGVMCRVQDNGSGIFFAVRSDGYGSIQKWDGISLMPLTDWQSSSSINQGIDANYIEGTCKGNNFVLYVNGDYVTEVEDSSFTDGRIGIGVIPAAAGTLQVDFDFVEALEPLK